MIMLNDFKIVTFLGSKDLDLSKEFYENTLGLNYKGRDEYALIFELNGVLLRINHLPDFTPKKFTAMGWIVDNIEDKVHKLEEKGVKMELYSGMGQDDQGITTIPDGTKLAYFKDPDSNILSLTQFQ
ncbi:MAG: VOC family protein [Candidatus Heimdallarchaeota archaeon]|nr:VOC family protein [Candidatus Heimdallarchaeota archaeon]